MINRNISHIAHWLQRFVILLLLQSGWIIPSQGFPLLKPLITNFSSQEYDAHVQVFCGAQDSSDGLWFGTSGKVLHYNGESWQKTTTRQSMAVFSMDIDQHGRIWLGGKGDFGYLRAAPSSSSRSGSSPSDTLSTPLSQNKAPSPGDLDYISLSEQLPDSLNNFKVIWNTVAFPEKVFFNGARILYVLDKEGVHCVQPRQQFFNAMKVNGRLWIQDHNEGLFRWRKDALSYDTTALAKIPGSQAFANRSIMKVLDDVPGVTGKNEVLVITKYKGVYLYNFGEEEPQQRVKKFGKQWQRTFKKAKLNDAIAVSPHKNPWGAAVVFSSEIRGLVLCDTTGRPVLNLDQSHGLPSNYVWSSIKGKGGMIWSTTNQGITRWKLGDPRTYALEGKSFSGGVNAITRYRRQLFLATDQGVYFPYYQPTSSPPASSRTNPYLLPEWKKVKSLQQVSLNFLSLKKTLLVGGAKGLYSIGWEDTMWEASRISPRHARALSLIPPTDSTPSTSSSKIIASGGRVGLSIFRQHTSKWQTLLNLRGLPGEILSIKAVPSPDSAHTNIWISLQTKGLLHLQLSPAFFKQNPSSTPININFNQDLTGLDTIPLELKHITQGVPNGTNRFFTYNNKIVLVSDSGIYTPSISDSVHFVPTPQLPSLFTHKKGERAPIAVKFLEEGSRGELLIAGRQQSYFLTPKNGGYAIDSLPFKAPVTGNTRSLFIDTTGILWIGGANGLMRYSPYLSQQYTRPFRSVIHQVKAILPKHKKHTHDTVLFNGFYRQSIHTPHYLKWGRSYEQPSSYTPTLSYAMNRLIFHFASPFYEKQSKVRYSYKLKGYDKEWSKWTQEPKKEYTNLAEGTYTFKVKAKNIYGVESTKAEYSFHVLPPWYRTNIAYAGYGISSILFIWFLIWLNGRRLRAQKRRLQYEVAKATQQIRQQKHKTEKQKEQIEQAHQEITDSINYAKHIQDTILPSKEKMESAFNSIQPTHSSSSPPYFVLLKPQHIVSGDFYWVYDDEKGVLWSSADCTGHGVPGAFVSLICKRQMEEVVQLQGYTDPGRIFDKVRDGVVEAMTKEQSEEQERDGMDATLCRIAKKKERESLRLQFAGANNPLYVVNPALANLSVDQFIQRRNVKCYQGGQEQKVSKERIRSFINNNATDSPTSGLVEIRGDRQAIGYEEHQEDHFTTIAFDLASQDCLYTFSDGYPDQFGGPKGKKFMYKRFRNLLMHISSSSMDEQKSKLEQTIIDWMKENNEEQIDDISVFGVCIK